MTYGLIGHPLSHSFSANYFNEKFQREKRDDVYKLFDIPEISLFQEIIVNMKDLNGLNVTIPYKEKILPYLHRLSPDALEIGAVNTIRLIRDSQSLILEGHNTDAPAFLYTILPLLKDHMSRALILGTGGASKAVAYALESIGITSIKVSRTKNENTLTYHEINEKTIRDNLIIVNTTPLGTYPDINGYPPIPYQFLTGSHLCYDLVYNPEKTLFLSKAEERGAHIKNGIEMLHTQANLAWDIWQR